MCAVHYIHEACFLHDYNIELLYLVLAGVK